MTRPELSEEDRVSLPDIIRDGQYAPPIAKWKAMGVRCSSCKFVDDVAPNGETGRCAKAQQALIQRHGWGERKVIRDGFPAYEKTGRPRRIAKVFDIKYATACGAWEPAE